MKLPMKTANQERSAWVKALEEVKRELAENERLFNFTVDGLLTDYVIHRQNALEAQFRYLLAQIRAVDAPVIPKEE